MLQPKTKINQKNNQIVFWLPTENYPKEAIYATAYVFIDRCYVYINGNSKKEISISLEGKEKLLEKNLEDLKGEFLNELLNYLLRVEIGKRNKKIRESIVGSALISGLDNNFLSLAGGDEKGKGGRWQDDPLGIAIPWEEKHNKRKKDYSKGKKKSRQGKNKRGNIL